MRMIGGIAVNYSISMVHEHDERFVGQIGIILIGKVPEHVSRL